MATENRANRDFTRNSGRIEAGEIIKREAQRYHRISGRNCELKGRKETR
jgi:hypothetical protein